MAKFRSGDLVLTATQRILQGSAVLIDANGVTQMNTLTLNSGETVNEISNDKTAPDADQLMTAEATQAAIVDATLAGTSGTSGSSGASGSSGTSGTSGATGVSGTSGTSGVSGTSGTSGSSSVTSLSGLVIRPRFRYKDTNEIYIDPGVYDHQGTTNQIVYWDTTLLKVVSGVSGWRYLYLDDSAIVSLGDNELTTNELIWGPAPTYSLTKHGWYNGLDRCIFATIWDNLLLTQTQFFHAGGDFVLYANSVEDLALTDIDTTWVDVILTLPSFCIEAQIAYYFNNNTAGNSEGAWWRTNGLSGISYGAGDAGHRAAANDADGQARQVNTIKVITDTSHIIEIVNDGGGIHLSAIETDGWYFPAGM